VRRGKGTARSMSSLKPKRSGRKVALFLGALAIVAAAVAYFGIAGREDQAAKLKQQTLVQSRPSVDVVLAERGTGPQELVLPGDIQAWYTAPILARVSGYVKMWHKDIGARVKAGELLAEIDTPDLDQQLEQARGDLATARAKLELAEITAKRWNALRSSDAVSQQSADEKAGEANAHKSEVEAAKARVGRLEAMENFKMIVAPFDGVVTVRNVDVGALVSATPSGNSHELQQLFEVSDVHKLRVYVQVPQAFAARLSPGLKAELKLSQFPDRVFPADLATTSNAISAKARTLLVELHCDNKDGVLQPGSFVEVHFKLPTNDSVLRVPTTALIFRGLYPEVAVVGADNKIILKRVEVGRDLGTDVEISSGLSPTDRVVRSPSDSIANGDEVKISTQEETPQPQVTGDLARDRARDRESRKGSR
jgi:RND family efflux transporter MFP subunit